MKKLDYIEVQAYIDDNAGLMYARSASEKVKEFLEANKGSTIDIRMTAELTRSQAQNKWFHSTLLPAIQTVLLNSGNMPQAQSKEWVKQIIIKKPYLTINPGTTDEYVRSTADLTLNEFWQFCNYTLELLIKLGGELTSIQQEKYIELVKKYKLEKAIDERLSNAGTW